MDVGLELRQARERLGLSLQRVSFTTKISPRVLTAIEACDVNALPARVFTRSFVRAYAKEVRLDPDDTVRRYLEQFEESAPASVGTAEADAAPPAPAPRTDPPSRPAARILHGRFGTATLLVLAAVAAVALIAGQHPRDSAPGPRAAVPVATAGIGAALPPAAAATSGTVPALDALHIAIAPTGPCWVQASVGDNRVFGTLLNAGDKRTIDAPSDVTLRVGDPATFVFAINGKPARIAGPAGQAVTVHINRQNYAGFLRN